MKKIAQFMALALASSGVFVAVTASSASAADCAVLVNTYRDGASNYAVVRNQCGREIMAQVVVDNFPDTGCFYIGAYDTRTFRTGGSFSPMGWYAREC